MGDHRIVFEVHKAVFKSKIEVFRRYAEELESKFQSDLKRIESEFDFEIADEETDEDFISYIESMLDEKRMVEQDFINQYRRSTIVSIYSLLEHRLGVISELLGRLKKSNLKISDLSGDGIVRNKKYLEKVCDVDFAKLNQEWSTIMDLNSLRNCIVHCEGDVSKSRSSTKLSNIIENTDGLRLEPDDTLVCELPYLEKIIDVAESFFSGTVDASFEVFKAYNNSSQKDALKRASA